MTKIVLQDLASLTNEQAALAALNSNSAIVETASDNFLSRDGTSPNTMLADLDMNSNDILNLPAPVSSTSPLRLAELSALQAALGGTINIGTNANSITYNEGATGAVSRTLGVKLQEFISIKDFGAVGDGSADDTATFTNAMAALPAGGGAIFLPAGTYKISTLTIAKSIAFIGLGTSESTVSIKAANTTGDVITCTAFGVSFENIKFTCASNRTSGAYVVFNGVSRGNLDKLYFEKYYIGVDLPNATSCQITRSNFRDGTPNATAANGAAIRFGSASSISQDTRVDGVTCDAANGSQPTFGFLLSNADATQIANCDVIHHGTCLSAFPGNGQSVASTFITNSFFDTATTGISLTPTGTGNVVRFKCTQVWASSHTTNGITISNGGSGVIDNVSLIGMHCQSNGTRGLLINSNSDCEVIGGTYLANTSDGIGVAANVNRFRIIGVKAGSSGGLAGNTGFGINVLAGTSDNYEIAGCDLIGNTAGSLSDNGTGLNKFVQNIAGSLTTSRSVTASGTQIFNTFSGTRAATTGGGGIPQFLALNFIDNSTSTTPETSNQIVRFGYTWNGATPSAAFDAMFDFNSVIQQNLGTLNGLEIEGPVVSNTKTLTNWKAIDITAPSGAGTVTNKVAINVASGAGSITTADQIRATSPTAGIGYGTGSGGTVTQATNKATAVTLNTINGAITTNNASLAAATIVSFTLNDTAIAATDLIMVMHESGGTLGSYTINGRATGAGTAAIDIRNNTAGALGEALVLRYAVIKSVNA